MAESKLVQLNLAILCIDLFSMQSLGCILISHLVVADLFMHSLPVMILLYLAESFLH